MACSQCDGVEQVFDNAEARKALRRFRRRGPDKTTRLLIEALRVALTASGARDAVLLDIGAGVGAIHHDLLDGPVSRVIHVDASSANLAVAREETARRGHDASVEFVRGDFVAMANSVSVADVVTLDRVICCYDDMRALVSRSADKATQFYGAVYPRQVAWMRIGIAGSNLIRRLKRTTFRVFLHDPSSIDRVLRDRGLERTSVRRTLGWEVVVYARRYPGSTTQ
jgi:2-polyprenyl-3-methyl-5-hydroxy-6-metoxy-1,4-benzoquinol methylase